MKSIVYKRKTLYLIWTFFMIIVTIICEFMTHARDEFILEGYLVEHLFCLFFLCVGCYCFLSWRNKSICFSEEGIKYTNLIKREYFYRWDEIKSIKEKFNGRSHYYYVIYFTKGKISVDYDLKLKNLFEEKKLIDDIQTKVLKATSNKRK